MDVIGSIIDDGSQSDISVGVAEKVRVQHQRGSLPNFHRNFPKKTQKVQNLVGSQRALQVEYSHRFVCAKEKFFFYKIRHLRHFRGPRLEPRIPRHGDPRDDTDFRGVIGFLIFFSNNDF